MFSINDPTHKVVLVEDTAALTGFLIAGICISASMYFQMPVWDSIGSVLIGGLLCGVGSVVIRSNFQHLMNRSVPTDIVRKTIESDPFVSYVFRKQFYSHKQFLEQ